MAELSELLEASCASDKFKHPVMESGHIASASWLLVSNVTGAEGYVDNVTVHDMSGNGLSGCKVSITVDGTNVEHTFAGNFKSGQIIAAQNIHFASEFKVWVKPALAGAAYEVGCTVARRTV